MRSILGQEAAKEAASATTSKRSRRSAAASKRASPKEESNKENRRRSTAAMVALGRLQSSAEDIVKSGGGGDVDLENAVVEVQFVTNQVPAKRVSAQLGEFSDSQNSQTRCMRSAKRDVRVRGLVKFVPSVAYLLRLALLG